MLEKIREKIEEPLSLKGIIVDDISYEKEGNNNFLRIVIDNSTVVDLDTCVEATHIVNDILDEIDIIEEAYILDISSKEKGGK